MPKIAVNFLLLMTTLFSFQHPLCAQDLSSPDTKSTQENIKDQEPKRKSIWNQGYKDRKDPPSKQDLEKSVKEDSKQFDLSALPFMLKISQNCPNIWEEKPCLQSLAVLSHTMATDYSDRLEKAGHGDALEPLKQHCAAATAAAEIDVPAYAMKSALTECINHISDTTEQTEVPPDLNMYQLAVSAVICMNKDEKCKSIEAELIKLSGNYAH